MFGKVLSIMKRRYMFKIVHIQEDKSRYLCGCWEVGVIV